MNVGVLVGRFQPLHNGHLIAIQFALLQVDFLYVVIGSAEKSHEQRNPFTADERIRMLNLAFDEQNMDCRKMIIVAIPDADTHSVWVSYVDTYAMNYSVVFSNDPLTSRLFKEKGMNVIEVPMKSRNTLYGTGVRNQIQDGKRWKNLVPGAVARVIDEIDGESRIRGLA